MSDLPVFSSFPDLPSTSTGKSKVDDDSAYSKRKRKHEPEKHRLKRQDRSNSPSRQRKEDRRKRDREAAQELIRATSTSEIRSTQAPNDFRKPSRADDTGTAWYQTPSIPGPSRYSNPGGSSGDYFADTTGDKDAVRYGSEASYTAPRYHRAGKGRVLGLNEGLRVVVTRDRTTTGIELAPAGRPYIPRYSTRTLDAAQQLGRFLVRADPNKPFDPYMDEVTFDEISRRKPGISEIPDYRDIGGATDEADIEDLIWLVGDALTVEEDLRSRTTEIERHLQSHQNDISTCITYSTHHLKSSTSSASDTKQTADTMTRANAEVTLSILSRALTAHPSNDQSSTLHIAYLHAAEAFWPPADVTKRWQNVLRETGRRETVSADEEEIWHRDLMTLWIGYIQWKEGQGFGKATKGTEAEAGVDELIAIYFECLSSMMALLRNRHSTVLEENMLYIFTRACLFLKHAGYEERALAAFQTLTEITFFKPDHLRPPLHPPVTWFDDVLSAFEEFWDEESPRIGEKNARGWRNAEGSKADELAKHPTLTHESTDPFTKWLEAESHAVNAGSLPGRATDLDLDEEDPFRIILFNDIQPFLFPIRSPEVRLQLIYAFLNFLGLSIKPPEMSTNSPVCNDPALMSSAMLDSQAFWPAKPDRNELRPRLKWQTVGGEPMEMEEKPALSDPFACPVKCCVSDLGSLFARPGSWFRDFDRQALDRLPMDFIGNVFALLSPVNPDPTFALSAVALEAAVSAKSAVKTAKSMLSKDRDNLVLWDGYARLERQRGNVAAARAVYITALQAVFATKEQSAATVDEAELWAAWAMMEWEEGEEGRCLGVLVATAGVGQSDIEKFTDPALHPPPPSAVVMLQCRRFYDSLAPPLSPEHLVLATLFAYVTAGIEAALNRINAHIALIPNDSHAAESAHQLSVKLLYIHSKRHSTPAYMMRNAVESAIQSFRSNTIFLSLYLWGESGLRVHGRIQRLTSELSKSPDPGLIGLLWSVWAEAMLAKRTFWDEGGGGAERCRMVLDNAVNSSTGKRSAMIWKLYITFETAMKRFKPAKQLCYRAVAQIPGCKELYLLPFQAPLRQQFTPREMRDWADLMIERGIRVRVPFEQFWENAGDDEAAMELPEDEELEEDELGFLREREMIKPY